MFKWLLNFRVVLFGLGVLSLTATGSYLLGRMAGKQAAIDSANAQAIEGQQKAGLKIAENRVKLRETNKQILETEREENPVLPNWSGLVIRLHEDNSGK